MDDFAIVSSSGGQITLVENFGMVCSVRAGSGLFFGALRHSLPSWRHGWTPRGEPCLGGGPGHGLLPGEPYHVLVVCAGDGHCCLYRPFHELFIFPDI